jgi:heme exporter protein D
MSFNSVADFIQMGGHGVFVWSCYAITLIVLVANILRPLQLKSATLRARRRTLAREIDQNTRNTHGEGHDPVPSQGQESP